MFNKVLNTSLERTGFVTIKIIYRPITKFETQVKKKICKNYEEQ